MTVASQLRFYRIFAIATFIGLILGFSSAGLVLGQDEPSLPPIGDLPPLDGGILEETEDIDLVAGSQTFSGRIEMDAHGRLRLFWRADFNRFIREKYADIYSRHESGVEVLERPGMVVLEPAAKDNASSGLENGGGPADLGRAETPVEVSEKSEGVEIDSENQIRLES